MNGKNTLGATLIAAILAAAPAAAADLWLHVKVDGGKDGEQATINVPLSMVDSLAPMMRGEGHGNGRVRLQDHDYSAADLRRIWSELEKGPDATYVTVSEKDSNVRVAKRGGYLEIESHDRGKDQGENVHARLPLPVVRALLSGPEDEIDVAAALKALANQGEGELITVTGDDENVRMWVDAVPEAR